MKKISPLYIDKKIDRFQAVTPAYFEDIPRCSGGVASSARSLGRVSLSDRHDPIDRSNAKLSDRIGIGGVQALDEEKNLDRKLPDRWSLVNQHWKNLGKSGELADCCVPAPVYKIEYIRFAKGLRF